MTVSWTELGLILLMCWLTCAQFVLCLSAVGKWCGLSLKECQIGIGPLLRRIGWLGGTLDFRLFPFASSVGFWGQDELDQESGWSGLEIFDLPRWQQAFIYLSGPIVHLLLGAAILLLFPTRAGTLVAFIGFWMGFTCLLPLPGTCGWHALRALFWRPTTRPHVGAMLLTILLLWILNGSALYVLLFRSEWLLSWAQLIRPF